MGYMGITAHDLIDHLLNRNGKITPANNEKLKPKHLVQKDIYPTGNKACITRMVYKTKHSKGESQGPAPEAPRTPITDGDYWECRQGVTDQNAPPIQYRTVITKGLLRLSLIHLSEPTTQY